MNSTFLGAVKSAVALNPCKKSVAKCFCYFSNGNSSVGSGISLKRKIIGSIFGGVLFTVMITWFLVGLLFSFLGVTLGGLPIPFWFGSDKVEWLFFIIDTLFRITIIGIADYCFIGKEGTRIGKFLHNN